ncbi:MAG: N-formylglutamate amidohydrolase [Thermomonas sp.]
MTEPRFEAGPPWWTLQRGDDCIVATAIHDGNGLSQNCADRMQLADADRLREEDPHTGQALLDIPTHIIAGRSRFEVDLNRDVDQAVYRTPEQAWGLDIWREPLTDVHVENALRLHRAYYAMLGTLLDGVQAAHGRFVVLDVHSYNHRRSGPDCDPSPQADAPDVNIGTFSMPRDTWAHLLDPLMDAMRGFEFNGRHLDVRENVAFQGKGEQTRFVHARYPDTGCAIAIEFKKFYMDEWTGQPDPAELAAMRAFMTHVAATCRNLLHG